MRTLGLFGELSEQAGAGFLSGLLIGHEVRAALQAARGRDENRVRLIGDATLVALYAEAIAACGGRAEVLVLDMAAAGLALIGRQAAWR